MRLIILVAVMLLAGCAADEARPPGGDPTTCDAHADCPAGTPACSAGVCGPCASDAACEGRASPRCERAAGACVACTEDAHCPVGRCNERGNCVACLESGDCASGFCVDQTCRPGCTADAQCAGGETCIVSGAGGGSCAVRCDPYDGSSACAGEARCALLGFDAAFRPWGACLPPSGGAGAGESCETVTCEIDLACVDLGGGRRCAAFCDPATATDGCGAGFSCTALPLSEPTGASIGLCARVPAACTSDADCAGDEVCALDATPDGGLDQRCLPALGPRRGGETCAGNAECASGFCLQPQQVCYGACVSNAGCAGASVCVEASFGADKASACFPSCTDDAACGEGSACLATQGHAAGDLVAVCSRAVGDSAAGAACTTNDECRSGFCSAGLCFGICDGDDDCAQATECVDTAFRLSLGADNMAGTADDVWQRIGTCHGIRCAANAECGGGRACRPMPAPGDTRGELVEQRCALAAGPLRGGVECGTAADCISGICFDPRVAPEDCADGVDNDGDGAIDCDDLECHDACFRELDCGNGIDDDGDGAIDCEDGDCAFACSWEGNCADGRDDDGNGLVDCDDPDCAFACGRIERNCTDGIDDDGDGFTDCRDPDCNWSAACRENAVPARCANGLDDDHDGWVDCQDPDCSSTAPCDVIEHEGSGAASLCIDGLDNDGDGLIDCADPGCALVVPCTESACGGSNCCADGLDNDGDGRADCLDLDCARDPACSEAGFCADGADNDADGLIDCHDDDCRDAPPCNERRCAAGGCCSDGLDNDGDGGVDCADADCFADPACNEAACSGGNCCGNGRDDDGDGRMDCEDPACVLSPHCRETTCRDGLDNDQDGATDCDDDDCFSHASCAARICFEACAVEADCSAGMSCVEDAAWVTLDFARSRYGYVAACMEAPAP